MMMLRKVMCGLIGFGLCAVFSGCGPSGTIGTADQDNQQAAGKQDGEHGHETAESGPHGGHLIALGNDQFHAELLHDEPTHTVTVHLLDVARNQPVTSDQPALTLQVFRDGQFVDHALAAVRAGGAAEASEFKTVDEGLCDYLLHGKEVKGRLKVTIAGEPLVGTIEHQAHEHDAHDHEGADHDPGEQDPGEQDDDGHDHDEDAGHSRE